MTSGRFSLGHGKQPRAEKEVSIEKNKLQKSVATRRGMHHSSVFEDVWGALLQAQVSGRTETTSSIPGRGWRRQLIGDEFRFCCANDPPQSHLGRDGADLAEPGAVFGRSLRLAGHCHRPARQTKRDILTEPELSVVC